MEKESDTEDLVASVDLGLATQEQLGLLEAVDSRGDLYDGRAVREAIRRYLVCWLPLLAEGSDEDMLPPRDIHWVWYCHALSPNLYREETEEIVGTKVKHAWVSRSKRSDAMRNAASRWEKKFKGEPFEKDDSLTSKSKIPESLDKLAQRLEGRISEERNFYYQVSLPHHRKDEFIDMIVVRYQRFLSLVKKKKKTTEVSPDVELLWRSHILQTESYSKDCDKWFGGILDHNSTVDSTGSPTRKCSPVKGRPKNHGIFAAHNMPNLYYFPRRGDSPIGRLAHLPEDEKMSMSAKTCEIEIEEILVEGYRIESKGTKISTSVDLMGRRDNHHVSKRLVDFSGSHYNPEEKKPIAFQVDPERYDSIMLTLTKRSGSVFKSNKSTQGSHTFDLISLIETCPNQGTTFSESGSFNVKDLTVRVSARGSITPNDRGTIHLNHVPGTSDVRMSSETDEVRDILLRTGLQTQEVTHIGDVLVSTHRFINRSSRLIFTCKFLQKLPYLSLVQVFSRDELLAEGHFLSATALPNKVIPNIPSLDEGEKGFVLKNAEGDWGILVGRLSPTPGASRASIQHQSTMRLYTLAPVSKLWTTLTFDIPGPEGSLVVEGSGFNLDLKTGKVMLLKSCPDVAETVALAYGIASLHALLWSSNKDPVNASNKFKPTVRFAGHKEDSWADVAQGVRFLKLVDL